MLVFPWQRWDGAEPGRTLSQHLRERGRRRSSRSPASAHFAGDEEKAAGALGLTSRLLRDRAPAVPAGLAPPRAPGVELSVEGTRAPVRLRAYMRGLDRRPTARRCSPGEPDGRPAAFVFARHRGRVAVLPAALFANAALG